MMDGREFLAVADVLSKATKQPSYLRSSVNRAYYATYTYARHTLRNLGFKAASEIKDHGRTWSCFRHTAAKDLQKALTMVFDLQESRRGADYDMDKPKYETSDAAKVALMQAKNVIGVLERCENDATFADELKRDMRQGKVPS